MIGKTVSALAAAALLAGVTIAAQPANRPPAKSGSERLICRVYHENGTRLGGYRVCHTAAEWDELRRQMKQNIDHIQNARPS